MTAKHLYGDLTWPEVNDVVQQSRIPILPVGTIEQHGPHLPIKIDQWSASTIAEEAARRSPHRLLAMPTVSYGYTKHVMDFPGTVTIHHETFIRYVVDILNSLAYHGFEKIIVLNGHGANVAPLDLAARRAMLDTKAWVAMMSWWSLATVNGEFLDEWRESDFPGGCFHAGEAETSLALHLDSRLVRMDLAGDHQTDTNAQRSKYHWLDLWASSPVAIAGWTSTFSENGTMGEASRATAQKGKALFEEVLKNLIEFADEFAARDFLPRVDHHAMKPATEVPG